MEDIIQLGPLTLDGVGTVVDTRTYKQLSGTTTDTVIRLDGRMGVCEIQSKTGTSLAVKVYCGLVDGDGVLVWTPVVSWSMGSSSTAADVAVVLSDTATAEKTVVRWDCGGFSHVKVARTAGSGTVMFSAVPIGGLIGLAGALAVLAAATINEDTAASNLEILLKKGSVRRDVPASSAGANLDWATDNQDEVGASWVHPISGGMVAEPTVTVDTVAYVNLDCVGGIIELANFVLQAGDEAIIDWIRIVELGAQSPPVTFSWYSATPAGGTYADNGALALDATDVADMTGYPVRFVAGDFITHGTFKVAGLVTPGLLVQCTATSLFFVIQADGAYDAVATSDFKLAIGYRRL